VEEEEEVKAAKDTTTKTTTTTKTDSQANLRRDEKGYGTHARDCNLRRAAAECCVLSSPVRLPVGALLREVDVSTMKY